eukprot:5856599-Prymnesium_polylepis.1
MSLLQLGIIGLSLARGRMAPQYEQMIAGCATMKAKRHAGGVGPLPEARRSASKRKRYSSAVAGGGEEDKSAAENAKGLDGDGNKRKGRARRIFRMGKL